MSNETIKGFKGFDKDLKCRDFQYEVGKEFEMDGDIKCCERGFHSCEHPLDVFEYYPPSTSRYCKVEQSGVIDSKCDKIASSKIRIGAELSIEEIVNNAVNFTFSKCKYKENEEATGDYGAASATGYKGAASATGYNSIALAAGYKGAASATGDYGAASATGYYGAASATGYKGAASATGDYGAASATGDYGAASATGDYGAASATGYKGAASATGDNSIALAAGYCCKAKGAIGCWLCLAERDDKLSIKEVRAVKVDGETVKADTWYMLVNGEVNEVE